MKQYKVIRIDMETYKNFLDKQNQVSKIMCNITGKKKQVSFTKVLKLSSKSPIFYMGKSSLIKDLGEMK